jgi:alkylation response protein AidB-like acyl-CoA dehydrogenase
MEDVMDFEPAYTPEQEAFRQEVKSWLKDHVPDVAVMERDFPENYQKYRQLGRDLGSKGWLWPTSPPEYGGGGLSVDEAIVIAEELDRYELTNPPYYDSGGRLGGASILVHGSEEQRQRWLPPIMHGEVVTWQLLTGPEAGSDLAGTQTDAVRDGDEFVLNGDKIYIGGSGKPDFLWTIARSDRNGERHKNLSWFMIPSDLPGITIKPMELLGDGTEGIGSAWKNTIYFEDVRVPAANLVGGENNGWTVASTHLELEHGSGGRIGRNRRFLETLKLATELRREGKSLIEHDDVRDRLVDLFVQTEVDRLFALRNFWMNQSGVPMSYEGPQSSYFRKVGGLKVISALIDIMGPYALTTDEDWGLLDGRVEGWTRSAIQALHPGATADIQKVIMARRIGIGREVAEKAGDTKGAPGL